MRRLSIRVLRGAAVAGGLVAVGYPALLRRRCLHWGASLEETTRMIPGENLVGHWVWQFALYPEGGSTRLISRNLITVPRPSIPNRLFNLYVMEPGSLIMEQRMLRGIKQRAERLGTEEPAAKASPVDSRDEMTGPATAPTPALRPQRT